MARNSIKTSKNIFNILQTHQQQFPKVQMHHDRGKDLGICDKDRVNQKGQPYLFPNKPFFSPSRQDQDIILPAHQGKHNLFYKVYLQSPQCLLEYFCILFLARDLFEIFSQMIILQIRFLHDDRNK